MSATTVSVGTGRRALLRWTGWFTAVNGLLSALIGIRYLVSYPFSADALGVIYLPLAYAGHFASLGLLAMLPAMLLAGLLPRRLPVMAVAVVGAALLLTALVTDASVFAEHRYHLTPLTVAIFAGTTWFFIALVGVMALVFEALLAGTVWRFVGGADRRGGWLVAAGLVMAWIAGQGIHIWADAAGYTSVTQLTRYLPAYFPVHAKRRLAKLGLVDPATIDRQRQLQRAASGTDGQLRYPLSPLACERPAAPLNILVMLVDALRPDVVVPALTPRLSALAAGGQLFSNHWSGGNSSRAGIFSFFYGLPSTYVDAFYGLQQRPVLIEELQRQGYEFALFAAPGFGPPTDLNRTVFAGIPGLPLERHDLGAGERNRAVTDSWLRWLDERRPGRTQPFFGFLYYDPPMAEMSADTDPALPLQGRFRGKQAREPWTQYRRAVQIADGELGRVLDDLGARGLDETTLVIVFSDHGYEFDDYGNGTIGHASSFSPAQLRATLVIRWPGSEPALYPQRTAHQDVAPTLLAEALGCRNQPADYSSGGSLFDARGWDWIVAGSYGAHAIVQPGQVVVAHPGGFVEVLGPDYRALAGAGLDSGVVGDALAEMRRFYR